MYSVIVAAALVLLIILLILGKPERHYVGLIILLILLLSGTVTLNDVIEYIEWDVFGLIICVSIFTVFIEESGLAHKSADIFTKHVKNPRLLSFLIILLAGIVSIALENVTVVLIFTPLVFKLISRVNIDPVSLMIGVILASNMAGSATLIGDPQAMIVAGHYGLGFLDFIYYKGRPSMFFLTLIPMLLSTATYTLVFIKPGSQHNREVAENNNVYTYDRVFALETLAFLLLKIFLLSIKDITGLSLSESAAIALLGLIIVRLLHKDLRRVIDFSKRGFEWRILLFLSGVFVLSGAFEKYGLARIVAETILRTSDELVVITSIIIWLSVAISAIIDNVPYIATMLPVIDSLAKSLKTDPIILAWALLLGATLGGGITYIGASANVVGIQILEKRGYRVSFGAFIKRSLPFNLVNVFTGWILYMIFWIIY